MSCSRPPARSGGGSTWTRPVEREVLLECLALATQAPSGSNSQQWQWLFVTDPDKKRALAEIYDRVLSRAYPPERAARWSREPSP